MNELVESVQLLLLISVSVQNFSKKTEKSLGLSLVQWSLLKHLVDLPGVTANKLAEVAGVHPSTLTQMLRRLEKKKLVLVAEDPKDSRKKIISITRTGKHRLDAAEEKLTKVQKQIGGLAPQLKTVQRRLSGISLF